VILLLLDIILENISGGKSPKFHHPYLNNYNVSQYKGLKNNVFQLFRYTKLVKIRLFREIFDK